MHEVSRRIGDRYACLHLDLENCQSAGDAIVQLSLAARPHKKLWGKVTGVFQNILGHTGKALESISIDELTIKLRDGVAGVWRDKGDRLMQSLDESGQPMVLFIDELPILVNRLLKGPGNTITPEGQQKADEFVSWLRSITIRRRNSAIRLVVTGSIGLEPVLKQAGLSATINTLTPFELNPWDDATAIGCLEALANHKGITFAPHACEQVAMLLGSCIPHHVQLFFTRLYEDCRRRKVTHCTPEDVARIYKERMLSAHGHVELSHMEERLKQVFPTQDLPLILELLTETAVTGALAPKVAMILAKDAGLQDNQAKSVLTEALYIFEHDGYLKRTDNGQYIFHSKLLRDWWGARHGQFHTPANSRKAVEES